MYVCVGEKKKSWSVPNKSVRYSSSVCMCRKKNRWWLILFSLGTKGEKKPYWLLSGVCIGLYSPSSLKASTLSYYYTTPPPSLLLGFFFSRWFFSLGDFFFSPLLHFYFTPARFFLSIHTHNSRWCAVWSSLWGEEMKENYTGLSASHYTSTFFFSLPFSSPLFFLYLGWSKKKNNR